MVSDSGTDEEAPPSGVKPKRNEKDIHTEMSPDSPVRAVCVEEGQRRNRNLLPYSDSSATKRTPEDWLLRREED